MTFLDDDFLLDTAQARTLYHQHAAPQPIIDYHCHLPPEQVAADYRFRNMTEIWLGGDHYKWRAMRSNGVPERLITGNAPDREKFAAWAATMPQCLRNPLYHWTHLELKRPFGMPGLLLSPSTEERVWNEGNARLAEPGFSAQGLMQQFDVRVVCTTDSPEDSLEHHQAYAKQGKRALMLPTWRPDRAMAIDDPAVHQQFLQRLGAAANVDIRSFADLIRALDIRHDFFHAQGCRLSDHGLETVPPTDCTDSEAARIFAKVLSGQAPDSVESERFKGRMLVIFAEQDHAKGWVQQFHIGAIRNNNPRLFRNLGPDTGFDSIGDHNYAVPLSRFLGRLDDQNKLTKTILYNLNPRDNEMIGTMIGNFQDGSVPGKIQFGSGWWFLDQMDGMTRQIEALSQLGLLSRFVGMLTDSRSFLSYVRHEYFRRILCGLLGRDMARGLIPDDMALVAPMVENICFGNAKQWFPFKTP